MAYKLVPAPTQTLLAKKGSHVEKRAAFASRNLWVTQAREDQRWPGAALVEPVTV